MRSLEEQRRDMVRTSILAIALTAFSGLSWAQDGKPTPDLEPPPQVQKLSCSAHVEILGSAVQNLQIQIAELWRRLQTLLAANEQLRLNSALKAPQAEFVSNVQRAIAGSGADPNNCRVALLTGKITCNPLTPSSIP